MINKISAILKFEELNYSFFNMIDRLINQTLSQIEIIVILDSDKASISKLKDILGENKKIKFFNKSEAENITDELDSEFLIFCNEQNILEYDALSHMYKSCNNKDEDIFVFNYKIPKVDDKADDNNLLEYGKLDVYSSLFKTAFVKDNDIDLNELADLNCPASLFKVVTSGKVLPLKYNPFIQCDYFKRNRLCDWKKYLSSLDEFYTYLIENDLEEQYLSKFSNFFIKYVYDLFCFKDNEEAKKIVKYITDKVPSFMKIIKDIKKSSQYDIFKKYFKTSKKTKNTFSDRINVALYCDEENAPFTVLSVLSIIEHINKNILYNIHILHNGISDDVIRNLFNLSSDNVNILFMDIRDHVRHFNIDIKNVEIIIPEIFCNLENVIYIKNNTLFKFDVYKLLKEKVSENCITGLFKDNTNLNMQDIALLIFNIKKCLENKIPEQMFLFCDKDVKGKGIGNYVENCSKKYDFVCLNNNLTDSDMDDFATLEWLNYSKKTVFYEWLIYKMFEKVACNG